VSFHESGKQEKRTGADLMADGITIESMLPGELVYLNLPMHPGSKLDKDAPKPASAVVKRPGSNMGYPGIELTWKPGSDNNWISYYEVIRDGKVIDKVSKGTFYFDHSAGADMAAKYEIKAVDGSGNRSHSAAAEGSAAPRSAVYNDTDNRIVYTGTWERKTDLLPAHEGTISYSDQTGDYAELAFEGTRVLWFSKLGADGGKASVTIDGGTPEMVDTFSADDIWGVCVYSKALPVGRHTIRIQTTGTKNVRAKGTKVHIDGIRIEP
jgi:hypothetical protein